MLRNASVPIQHPVAPKAWWSNRVAKAIQLCGKAGITPAIVILLLAFSTVACDSEGGAIGSGPSALDLAERQQEYEERVEAMRPRIGGAEGKGTCDRVLARVRQREAVLDNALFIAIVNSDGELNREVYDLWGDKLKLLDDLERDLKTCQR